MDKTRFLRLYDQEERISAEEFGVRREQTPDVVRYLIEGGDSAWILYAWLNESNIDRVIDEQIAYFESLGRGFEWKVFDWDWPPDLVERLSRRGFKIEEPEAFAVLSVPEASPNFWSPLKHEVRRLERPDELDAVMRIQEAVWHEDFGWLRDELARAMTQASADISVYLAYADGQPVSSAWTRFRAGSRFASLFGGSTLPEFRGRGIYRDLVAVRVQEARRRGIEYLMVDASPMSRPILEKLGFQVLGITTPCKWIVPDHPG